LLLGRVFPGKGFLWGTNKKEMGLGFLLGRHSERLFNIRNKKEVVKMSKRIAPGAYSRSIHVI